MALPTLSVTPGSGATINTLPPAAPQPTTSCVPVALASDHGDVPVVAKAGSNNIGGVGATGTVFTPSLSVAATAHADGACIGGLFTLASAVRRSAAPPDVGISAYIQNAILAFPSLAAPTLAGLVVFAANPTASTLADGSPFSIAAADQAKLIGEVPLDYLVKSAAAYALVGRNLALLYTLSSSQALYGCFVNRSGASFTPASANAVTAAIYAQLN